MFRHLVTRALRVALVAAWALAPGACSPTDFLGIEDPDIINPSDVNSPAGANAVRIGAIARFNRATSGTEAAGQESLFLLGGLFADEWNNGDSFIARQEIDQRAVTEANTFLTTANRNLHRARLAAEQAIDLMAVYVPTAPAWQVAEMHLIQAYVVNLMAEHYCDGLVFSTVVDGEPVYGTPITTQEAFTRALGHADDGLALPLGSDTASLRVQYSLQVTRGRILLNLDRAAEAATAVAGVPTDFRHALRHSATSTSNAWWFLNNSARRYSVSTGEGTNGLDYATAADPRVPVCLGGDAACRAIGDSVNRRDDDSSPLYVQMLWTTRESPVTVMGGTEARMIEAEAQLATDPTAALATMNAARAMVPGLADLTDPGTPDGRVDQLFRERAFWLFGTGHRVGDLRRLIRQYSRASGTVFPIGPWHKGGSYGTDVNFPVPLAETNNPNAPQSPAPTCMNRDA